MKYKVGDKVKIKSLDWYNHNKNEDGEISLINKPNNRSSMDGLWKPAVFGFRNGYNDNAFYIVGGSCWKQCIPYLNNEHLYGTTNDCDDFYKTWE